MLISSFSWFPVLTFISLFSQSRKMSKASLLAGVYSLLFCLYVWVIIALFLTENHFNPIKDVFDNFFPRLEKFLLQEEKFNETVK